MDKKRNNDINVLVDDSNKKIYDTEVIAVSRNDYFYEEGKQVCNNS